MNLASYNVAAIVAALASIGTDDQLTAMGVTNGRVASGRTISFDLPDGKYAATVNEETKPVNRVKITADEGGVYVRLMEVKKASTIVPILAAEPIEHESIGPIEPGTVGITLAQKINLGL